MDGSGSDREDSDIHGPAIGKRQRDRVGPGTGECLSRHGSWPAWRRSSGAELWTFPTPLDTLSDRGAGAMIHARFIKSLVLLNCAVFVASINFLAHRSNYSFSYDGIVDHVLKKMHYTVDWERALGIMLVSILLSAALYYFVTALPRMKEPW